MTGPSRAVAAVALVAAACLGPAWLVAAPSAAAGAVRAGGATGQIKSITEPGGRLTVLFGVNGGDSNARLQDGSARLRVGDRQLAAIVRDASTAPPVTRKVLLVIDTSGSMRGRKIDGACGQLAAAEG